MAELGLCSRREAEALIAQGGVMVDDIRVEQPGHKIESGQTLCLTDAAATIIAEKFTAVLNKPVGYVSAQPEADQTPAVRLLTKKNAQDGAAGPHPEMRLAPLGRLDMDSHGLLILSEDGVLAKAIIGPQHNLDKEYIVKVDGKVTPGRLTLLRNGLSLDDRRLKPAIVTEDGPQTLRFILKEGRKRQIRRMCDLVGLKVVDLQRIRIGTLDLDDLREGQWRILSSDERKALISASHTPKARKKVAIDARPRAPAKARRAPRKPRAGATQLTMGKPENTRSPDRSKGQFAAQDNDRERPEYRGGPKMSAEPRANKPPSRSFTKTRSTERDAKPSKSGNGAPSRSQKNNGGQRKAPPASFAKTGDGRRAKKPYNRGKPSRPRRD